MKRIFIAHEPCQARKMLDEQLWPHVKAMNVAGNKCEIIVRDLTRNGEQNSKLHAMFSDISHQKDWAGSRHEITVWKRLLTAAWLRARGDGVQVYPALDGHGIDIVYERTSELSRKDCAELIEYVTAWAVDNDVVLHDGVVA